MIPVLPPSDAATTAAACFYVEGRCLAADDGGLILGDALGQVRLGWATAPVKVEPLSMVRVEVERRAAALQITRVVSQRPCTVTPAEFTRLVDQGLGARLRGRAEALAAVRRFFAERDYLEVETPLRVPSPGLDLHLDAFAVEDRFLITSPEYQMKRLVAGGLPRIFQFARCFRRGEQGGRHNPEFTMLEWYRAGADAAAMMDETEALVRSLLAPGAPPIDEARPSSRRLLRGPLLGQPCDVTATFERLSVAEAFERFAGLSPEATLRLSIDDEESYFRRLIDVVEPALAALGRPVFLHRYPASQASLARLCPDDPRFADRFELYVADLELSNGFAELVDPVEQRERLLSDQRARRNENLPVYPIDERFLAALEEGLPACAGNALGLDRLVALRLGAASVAEIMAFDESTL